jgi:hypothetical protein
MLASTVQFSTYDQTPTPLPRQTRKPPRGPRRYEEKIGPARANDHHPEVPPRAGPLPQDPTACLPPPRPTRSASTRHRGDAVLGTGHSRRPNWSAFHPRAPPQIPAARPDDGPSRPGRGSGPPARGWRPVLLRKEVIQPHLPVRLPCYDFVPIADPAFDGSLHKGWATGFGRYRLS